jgi:predicted anti-sigma-YlaC factor YlaD
MNCAEYERIISKLVDLEVKATTSGELFEHLGTCARCREFFDLVMKVNAELDNIGTPIELSEAASSRRPYVGVHASIPRFGQQRSLRSRISTYAMIVLLTFFIGLLFSVNINAQRQPEPIPQEMVQPR